MKFILEIIVFYLYSKNVGGSPRTIFGVYQTPAWQNAKMLNVILCV